MSVLSLGEDKLGMTVQEGVPPSFSPLPLSATWPCESDSHGQASSTHYPGSD